MLKLIRFLSLSFAVILLFTQGIQSQAAPATVITWFVGVGNGTELYQIDVERKVVENFNKSHPDINLVLNVPGNEAVFVFDSLVESGQLPDIVGPVGPQGLERYPGRWLDLKPLIAKAKFDMTQFPQSVVNMLMSGDTLPGLPLTAYPGLMYYNKDLFDEAGLPYPPRHFGDKYKLDGKTVDWTWDVVATIAKRLTIDSNGNDGTNAKFDPTKITQFGFAHQWDNLVSDFQTFGGASILNANGKVEIANVWRAEAKWLWNGIWKDHFIPNSDDLARKFSNNNAFASGHVAMARSMLWFTCCLTDLKAKWDLAPLPMYNGNYNAPADADEFRISNTTKNADAAFTVLQYLLGDAASDLVTTYSAFPARTDLQDSFIEGLAKKYPGVTNWNIVKPSLDYVPSPYDGSSYPNHTKGKRRFQDFWNWMYDSRVATDDIDRELDKFQSDLQKIVNGEQLTSTPTLPPSTVPATSTPPKAVLPTPVPPTLTPTSVSRKVVTWFIALGVGALPEAIPIEQSIVERFNKTHPDIELQMPLIGMGGQTGEETFTTLIQSGQLPDIVGPMSLGYANNYFNQWLDLRPFVNKSGYNLKQFPENAVKLYDENGVLVGLPFALYSGLMYYNADLFDAAGLAYPPAKFGDKYMLDGKAVDWNWDTVAQIAKRLTLDAAGNPATDAKFDPAKTVQYGFIHQWGNSRSDFSTFGGASVVDPVTGKVVIPQNWRAEAQWVWNGLWKDHFIPPSTTANSDLMRPSEFASGKVALARVMSWYTCCLTEAQFRWDLAPVPMYNGQYYAPADADTFYIMKASKNPDAAFTVLQYLLGEAAPELLRVYQLPPARSDLQDAYLKTLSTRYPTVKNWAIIRDSNAYTVIPHYESYFPGGFGLNGSGKGQLRFGEFRALLYGDTGKDIDVNNELDKLQSDLQTIVNQALGK